MSTTGQKSLFIDQVDDAARSTDERMAPYYSADSEIGEAEQSIHYTPFSFGVARPNRKPQERVIRRWNGFLVEMHGKEARVAFVEEDQRILYDLPADQLRRIGVRVKNQPFQMDEIEIQRDDELIVGYRFCPLAGPSDAYIESLEFDEERKRKRDLILKEFGKNQD